MSAEDSDRQNHEHRGVEMRETPHTFTAFDEALRTLRQQVLDMAKVVIHNTEMAMQGVLGGDVGLCNEVIAEDEVVDQYEKDVDHTGMQIMTRYRPIATDLRRVLSSMNMSRILERIADHAVNVSRQGRKMLKSGPAADEVKLLEPLFALAIQELRDAVTSFADDNEELALQLEGRDKDLDRLHKRLTKSLSTLIEERQEGASDLVHLLFISRSLERIGDLAVNVGEEVVFIELAEDIRHAHPG